MAHARSSRLEGDPRAVRGWVSGVAFGYRSGGCVRLEPVVTGARSRTHWLRQSWAVGREAHAASNGRVICDAFTRS